MTETEILKTMILGAPNLVFAGIGMWMLYKDGQAKNATLNTMLEHYKKLLDRLCPSGEDEP